MSSWQDKAAAHREELIAKIPQEWRLTPNDLETSKQHRDLSIYAETFLSKDELAIVSSDSVSLVNKLASGQLTAQAVTLAFCHAAAVAHQLTNCLHEIFFPTALARAKELDAYYSTHGRTMGPLHGLPISLKDQFHVKGVDTTMGYVGWKGTNGGDTREGVLHQIESQMTKEFLALGAVLYVKTSVPQTLLLGESVNNLIGKTLNPHNSLLSCGGSSGGEGALIGMKGSSLGVGTDIGGSVRIPAAFSGIYSLKPTHDRLSYRDMANTSPGQTTYASSCGFMASSLDGIALGMEAILSTKPWLRDPEVVAIPWRKDVGASVAKPLKLGIFWSDDAVTPHPPITRGLKMVVEAAKKAGHQIVEWTPPAHGPAAVLHWKFLAADGGHDIHKQLRLSGEPLIPELASFELRDPDSLIDYHDLSVQGRDFCAAYSDYWNTTGGEDGKVVDAFIMPVAPTAAVIPGKYMYYGYTQMANLLDYSACVIPVTRADKNVDVADPNHKALGDLDQKNWDAYDPEVYDGAPVGVQIVARKYEEEKVWAIAKLVEEALKMK